MRAATPTLIRLLVIAAAAAVVALLPFLLSGYHTGLGARVAVYVIAILGLNILTGYTGQISIGHGAFMAIGGYTTAIMSHDHDTNLIATLPLSLAVTFGCGILVGIPALRFSGVYLALATFALAVSVPQLPLKFSKFTGGSDGIRTSHDVSHLWLYGVSWTCVAVSFLLAWLLLRGRIGRGCCSRSRSSSARPSPASARSGECWSEGSSSASCRPSRRTSRSSARPTARTWCSA